MIVTLYGVAALTFMMLMYALEARGPRFVMGFALGCLLSSADGFVAAARPFGRVELVWSGIAIRRLHKTRALTAGINARGPREHMERNKALVARLVDEAVNQGRPGVLDELADGAVALAARDGIGPFRPSFPDFSMEIADLDAEGTMWWRLSSVPGHMRRRGMAPHPPASGSRPSARPTSSMSATAGSSVLWALRPISHGSSSSAFPPRAAD